MPEMIDKDAPQGLSWSWDLDFDTLVAAAADAAAAAPAAGGSAASPSDTSPGPSGPPDADSPRADSPGADPCPAGSSGDAAGATAAAGREAGLDDAAAEQDDLDNPDDLHGPDGLEGPDGADGTGQRLPATALTGRVAERLAPGPDLAAWLAMAPAAALDDHDLAAVAGSWRRVAAWAQARELAAVAQIASRAAARDKDIGTGPDGRPARVPASAAAEVSLELTMSQYGASWWTDLAVTLGWRLAATGAALDAGELDLSRARLIAEATGALSDEASRAVEERVLPAAGEQTTGMLRAALRRAVIAADPQGAEERRKESERRAKVVLYPDEENTATLAGQRLPTVHAAAAMARIKAMARALKASGAGGGMDLLCAQVYVGLLLGTLPLIPPAQGAPPDDPPAPPGADPPGPPGGSAPPGPPGDVPGQSPPRGPGQSPPRGSGSPDAGPGEPSGDNPDGHDPGAARAGGPGGHPDDRQSPGLRDGASAGPPRRNAAPPRDSPAGQGPRDCPPASGTPPGDDPPASGNPPSANDPPPHGMPPPGQDPPTNDIPLIRQDRRQAGSDPPAGDTPAEGVPPPGDADAPHHEDDYPCPDDGPVPDNWVSPGKDDDDDRWPAADWPALPTVIPPAFARPGPWANNASTADDRPSNGTRPGGGRSGLLDVSLPWQVLAGISAGPGHLGRIGPVTATQARRIAECAAGDPGAEWRIIVTTPEGAALAVTRIPRPGDLRRARHPGLDPGTGTAARSGTAPGIGMVSRVTLTIPEDLTTDPPPSQGPGAGAGPESAGDILDLAVRAAARAAAGARAAAAADAAAGGCAHGAASSSYRPPPRLQDYIAARDLTCRFLGCRQPAWRGDLDHTIAFDDGGLTCRCNLGGLCRTHHIIKHHPDWKLEQLAPGIFRWTTPSGRTFTATPDTHLV